MRSAAFVRRGTVIVNNTSAFGVHLANRSTGAKTFPSTVDRLHANRYKSSANALAADRL